jgi:hypothetical protein
MSNVFATLPAPPPNGTGAPLDVTDMAADKTFTTEGGFTGRLVVEASGDGGISFAPLFSIDGPDGSGQVITCACSHLRLRWVNANQGQPGTPVVDVAADLAAVSYTSLPIPGGNFPGTAVDTSGFDGAKALIITGSFTPGPSGTAVVVSGSADGASFDPVPINIIEGAACFPFDATYQFMRVDGISIASGSITSISLVSAVVSGGGVPFSYWDATPNNVDNTLASPGSSPLVSRGDHIHGLTFNDVINPQPVGATPSTGSNPYPAHLDHVHEGVTSVNSEVGALTLESLGGTISITKPTGNTINFEVSDPGATVYADGITQRAIQLASFPSSGLTTGTTAYVNDVDDYFSLQLSSLTADNITVVNASGHAGYQWLRLGVKSLRWFAVTSWFIDPVSGNDENDGQSSGTALKTAAEFYRRTNGTSQQDTNVTLLNDLADTDPINYQASANAGFAALTVTGTPVVAATVTIASVTGPNYAVNNNQLQQVNGPGGFNWAPYVGKLLRLQGTSGSTGTYAAVIQNLGGGSALLGIQVINGVPETTGFAASQTLEILNFSRVPGANFANTSDALFIQVNAGKAANTAVSVFSGLDTLVFERSNIAGNDGFWSSNAGITVFLTTAGGTADGLSINAISVEIGCAFVNMAGLSIAENSEVFMRDSLFYSTPITCEGSNVINAGTSVSPGVGIGIFALAVGQYGIATGPDSTIVFSEGFGDQNNIGSWWLGIDRSSQLQIQESLSNIWFENTTGGVKFNLPGNNAGNGDVVPTAFAGFEYTTYRGQNGQGPALASTSVLLPEGISQYQWFTITGTTSLDKLSILAETNGVTQLPDGFKLALFIENGLTINNNSIPADFVSAPFELAGGVNAVLSAGSWIYFYFSRQSAWAEISRTPNSTVAAATTAVALGPVGSAGITSSTPTLWEVKYINGSKYVSPLWPST